MATRLGPLFCDQCQQDTFALIRCFCRMKVCIDCRKQFHRQCRVEYGQMEEPLT